MAEKILSYTQLGQKIKEMGDEAFKHKLSEGSLIREKNLSNTIVDSLPGVFYIFDKKGKFLRWNKNFEEVSGYLSKEILSMSPLDFFIKEDQAKVADKIKETFTKGNACVEAEIESKNGIRTFFQLTGQHVIIDDKSCLIGLGIDISEHRRAENTIRKNEQFLDAIFNSIQDGISVLDSELNILRVNKTMQSWYAHMLPLEGRKCYESYHKRDVVCEICPTLRALDSGKLEKNVVSLTKKEGVTGTLELFAFPMLDQSGKTIGVVEYVRNITERKLAEEALNEAELIYRTVADFTYDWEYWIGSDGALRYISPSVERITGYQAQEFIENPELFQQIVFPEDRKLWDAHRHDTIRKLEIRKIQFRIIRRDGEVCWIEHACLPVTDSKNRPLGFRASNRDITDRMKAEEALKQYAEKIKLFAYSVSHDLKNPAIGINQLTRVLYENYNEILDEKGRKYCDLILKGSEELTTLVDQINIYINQRSTNIN